MGTLISNVAKEAPINELVGLLNSFDPNELKRLEADFPDYAQMLKPGITLGEKGVLDEKKELEVRTAATIAGLNLILKKANDLLPAIKKKLKRLNNIQFFSQIVVAISGASILIFLQEKYEEPIKIIIGSLTLMAALLSLYVQHRSGTIAMGENSLSKLFNDLTDYKLKAEHFFQELKITKQLEFSASKEHVLHIIQQSNTISLEIKKIIEKT